MSRECPVTGATCHNAECLTFRFECAFKDYPFSKEAAREMQKGIEKKYDSPKIEGSFINDEWAQPLHFGNNKDKTILHLATAIERLTRETEHHHRKHQRVEQALYFIFNNNKYIITMLSIASNQRAPIVLGLIDSDTKLPITATFAGETETSDNPAVATTDPTLGLVAVKTNTAGGSGNLTSVATWTYTDKNTNQLVTVQKTTVTPFTVTPVVTAENVEMVVTLGTPVTQP